MQILLITGALLFGDGRNRKMPLFYFHFLDDDGGREPDEHGVEFPTIEAAYLDACRAAMDMLVEARQEGRDLTGHRFEIRDATGNVVMELPLAEVLRGRA